MRRLLAVHCPPYMLNRYSRLLWRSYKKTNPVFTLVDPGHHMHTDILKAHVFPEQAKYE